MRVLAGVCPHPGPAGQEAKQSAASGRCRDWGENQTEGHPLLSPQLLARERHLRGILLCHLPFHWTGQVRASSCLAVPFFLDIKCY